MRKITFILSLALIALTSFVAGAKTDIVPGSKTIVYEFRAGDAIFYNHEIPGNSAKLQELFDYIDRHRTTIDQAGIRINVDAYSTSGGSEQANLNLSFLRANRVKSELIVKKDMKEEQFTTRNLTTAYKGQGDVVVVTIHLPQIQPVPEKPVEQPKSIEKPAEQPKPESVTEQPAQVVKEIIPEPIVYSRWSIGANIGVPFFWGDMNSLSADKTYIGFSAGLQGTYQITPLLGVTMTLDWAQNKAGAREYSKGYLLDPNGMTWYTPQSGTTQKYGDLYSKINMYSAGLHLDVNVNHLFGPSIANCRLKMIVSPAIYANHFSSKIYTTSDDKVYVDKSLSQEMSFGFGGDVALRYNLSRTVDLQLKGTGIWITDNNFDNVSTVGFVKHNAMWGGSVGVIWKLGTAGNRTNLLHKTK